MEFRPFKYILFPSVIAGTVSFLCGGSYFMFFIALILSFCFMVAGDNGDV